MPPTIPLGRFALRPLRDGDEAALHSYFIDPRVTEHTSIPPLDLAATREMVRRYVADYNCRINSSRGSLHARHPATGVHEPRLSFAPATGCEAPHGAEICGSRGPRARTHEVGPPRMRV